MGTDGMGAPLGHLHYALGWDTRKCRTDQFPNFGTERLDGYDNLMAIRRKLAWMYRHSTFRRAQKNYEPRRFEILEQRRSEGGRP